MSSNFSEIKNFLLFGQKSFSIKLEEAFLRIIINCNAFYGKFATFSNFAFNSSFFSKKKYPFFQEFSTFVRFEKFYFHRTLRQICHNLMRKVSNSERDTSVKSDILNWQKRKKNVRFQRFEWMIFLPYYKYRWKIIRRCIECKFFFAFEFIVMIQKLTCKSSKKFRDIRRI